MIGSLLVFIKNKNKMRSSKQAAAATVTENNRGISGHMFTLHQRLYHALNLGTRYSEGKEWKWKWKCTDIEIQRHVVLSISSFIESASPDTLHHPLVKDSMADIVWALVWILQHKSEAVLSIAANVVVKLIRIIPNSILQPYSLYLVHPLASLLSSRLLEVSIACATALNMILSNLSTIKEKSVWEILSETKTVFLIVSGIRKFSCGTMSTEYFQEMASLLSTILQKWSASRFSVWNDTKLMEVLEAMHENPDVSVRVALLKLYSGIALCGNGAMKLLQNGEALLQMMVLCMGRSHSYSVQMEGFRLAQRLATNKQGCLKMLNLCCEPIVKAIIDGMTGWTLSSGKIANGQMSLLVEACRLALIIRWDGEHHDYFWKRGIDKVLLDLLLEKFQNGQSVHLLTFEEQISEAQEVLKADVLLVLRPYIWDILGWLAIYCREDFNPSIHSHELLIDMLIRCACLTFTDSVRKGWQICQSDLSEMFRSESASRAVLMMIYSPNKYIASKARSMLSEILKPVGKEYMKHSLRVLNFTSTRENFGIPDMLQTGINLVALTCCACLSWYQSYIVKSGGVKILVAFIKWCLSNDVHIGRLSFAPHLHNIFSQRLCCWVCREDWEGNDILLLYGLWGLAELLHYGSISKNLDIFSGQVEYTEAQFLRMLQEICSDNSALGLKWNAAYILSYFGFYGFPCKLGRRIGKALDENEFADTRLILAKGESMSVHGVILAIRCPSFLPPEELSHDEKASDGSSGRCAVDKQHGKFKKEIRLSSHVDNQALAKLLEFVYLGYLQAGDEHVKKLKILAKHCSLQPLSTMLGKRRPKWGTRFPFYDLTSSLAPTGHHFSDITLKPKETESICWKCRACSLTLPHMHAHKVVLSSSCDYLQALFQSGMQGSRSQIIEVPVSWEAMIKLVNWFYTDELPQPPSGCIWDNMDDEEKLHQLQQYLELCWLAEFWFLEDVQDISYKVIVSCLDSARQLSIKIIKIASELSLWKLAEVAANYLAPFYRQLCHSGDLEALNEDLVDMIRDASVRLSQEG